MKPLCIYHGNCADGFCSAWVVRRHFGKDNVDFHAGVYSQEPPDVTGRDVIIVDFSYKRPVLDGMRSKAKSIIILDHHKTAKEDLDGFESIPGCKVETVFDMERSGAKVTWDYFFPETPAPTLLLHIQDRDLWKFKMEGTREIQASVFSYPYDFKVWDKLMDEPTQELFNEGKAIERKHFKDINELILVVTRDMVIGGYIVPVANLPYIFVSDAANKLSEGKPFAACYWDTPKGRVFGLRSKEDGLDVSEIAKIYGGGGHKNASGFTVSYEDAAKMEIK